MGVKNTQYERVTVYLKEAQLIFLDSLIEDLRKQGSTVPSRSDLVRAIIAEHTDSSDWMTQSLIEAINQYKNKTINKNKV
jgi:metal-responsive CopG/Arc/MetJ family transcriptional regulator